MDRRPTDLATLRDSIPALRQVRAGSGGPDDAAEPLVFADNASTSQKPQAVIDAVVGYYTGPCANVHRGAHLLAEEADRRYEAARESVAELVGVDRREVVFVRNTTEAIHLAGHVLGLGPDDEVVAAITDHHSNLLPWRSRARLVPVFPDADARLRPEAFERALTERTRLVAVGHASNVTGLVAPVAEIAAIARERGIASLVDAAQSVAHLPVERDAIGCDFLAFSGHKMMAPSGIGALVARRRFLDAAPPLVHGGGMVDRVGDAAADFSPTAAPHRFEAGTPNIEGAIGMGAAAEILLDLGLDTVREHGRRLSALLDEELATVPGLVAYPAALGAVPEPALTPALTPEVGRLPIRAFTIGDLPPDQVAEILSHRHGILVAAGVHCAEPLARHWGVKGLVRVSLHPYNTEAEVRRIGEALRSLASVFRSS